ncbi:hypothetical protein ACO0SA_002197 [Hanseniaspora valbyensis]
MFSINNKLFTQKRNINIFLKDNTIILQKRLFSKNLSLKNTTQYRKPEFSTEPPKYEANDNKRRLKQMLTFGACALIGYTISANYSFMDLITIYTSSNNSQDAKDYKIKLQAKLIHLPIVKQLSKTGFVEIIGDKTDASNGYDLLNELGGVAIPPKSYYNPQTKKLVDIVHIGMKLQGYPFMLHGGVSSDIISQFMIKSLKFDDNGAEVKNYQLRDLKVDYKAPVFVNKFIVLRLTNVERIGKTLAKCNVEVYSENGKNLLMKGKGKFAITKNKK